MAYSCPFRTTNSIPNSFRKIPIPIRNWSNTTKGVPGGGSRYGRQKRDIVGQTPIRTLQIGAIYQDNEEGRRKKNVFEVSTLLHQDYVGNYLYLITIWSFYNAI